MRGDSWHREPPLHATTVEEVVELLDSLHDCWINVDRLVPERIDGVIVSYRLPLALDDAERQRNPWPWELIVRSPRSLSIEDEAEIAEYDIWRCEVTPERVVIESDGPLRIEIGIDSVDVAVEARVQDQTAGSL